MSTPATPFAFELVTREGAARLARLHTPHGVVDTPAFMPVGTRAALKGLSPAQVRDTGTQIVLANTYHLMLRPGAAVVEELGGLHAFMGWDGPILTDSGGFQVFSLSDLRELDDDAVRFRSHIDGALVELSPESAMRIQNQLGADIIMALDECPPLHGAGVAAADAGAPGGDPAEVAQAVDRTIRWARRCRAAHARADQALYGIVQGGLDLALRQRCLDALVEIGFDGYALGGLSVGEPPARMHALLHRFADCLPADRPRYLMGVGTPTDLLEAVAAGVDQFDCVLPTRNGRKGYAFTSGGVVRLRNSRHRRARDPLDPACECYTCRHFSRGYLRHLFLGAEVLGATLVSLHNVHFYQTLMRATRASLAAHRFERWRRELLESPACCVIQESP